MRLSGLLRISARKSDLARLQAYQVGKALTEKNPSLKIEYCFRESLGDKNLTDPLWKMPEKGVFTEDFVQDLLDEKTDVVVHSWKDLPTSPRSGTKIVATLPRADQRDLLLFKKSSTSRLKTTKHLKVFSSSPRRAYNLEGFLKEHLPYQPQVVEFQNVRGNIQTRVRKLMEEPEVDALILAKAALDRLLSAEEAEFAETKNFLRQVLQGLQWMVLPLSINPNAAAQGALAMEVKEGRPELENLLQTIQCPQTFASADQERQVLASYGGGCHQKIGVAVLPRPYGSVFFLQGLTDRGEVLRAKSVLRNSQQKYSPHELASSRELKVTRTPVNKILWPPSMEALWVSKAEAMPLDFPFQGLIWTAGLTTWKKLAARNYWVHGSAEGLGEHEVPRVEILHAAAIAWTKLSHSESPPSSEFANTVATYNVKVSTAGWSVGERKSFFWHSGSQFLAALQQAPELRNKKHACGPGSTYKILREHLGPSAEIEIFLDEEEWRASCSL